MAAITVIGTGNMGQVIARLLSKGADSVQILDRDLVKAEELAGAVGGTPGTYGDTVTGDVVVLAVPYPALADVVDTYGSALSGRTVVDISNPVDFTTFDGLVVPSDGSAAAVLAEQLPGASVVKAFNTNFAAVLGTGSVGTDTATVLIAGDDADGKETLAALVEAGGLRAVDAGNLRRARELEAIGFLAITLAAAEKIGWTGGFALQR